MKNLRVIISAVVMVIVTVAIIEAKEKPNGNKNSSAKKNKDEKTVVFQFFNDYEKDWKTADSLYNIGLPKSALEIVAKIYDKAKAESNYPNLVRAIIYKVKLNQNLEEDDFINSLNDVKNEAASSPQPLKQILHSILADFYWSYYQSNKYQILGRTETRGFVQDDIRTWDMRKLVEQTMLNYSASVENPEALKYVNLDYYNDILNNYVYDEYIPNGRYLRPTLYDFLMHRAIDFYLQEEAGLTRPAEQFLLNDKIFFSDADEYANLDITTRDEYSFDFRAAVLLRDIIKFHLNDSSPDALIDADLKRLRFVYDNSGNADKEKLYIEALERLGDKYSLYPASANVSYEIAKLIYQRSRNYNPEFSDEHKYDAKTAYDICQKAIDKFPDSQGASNCKSLQISITQKSINLTVQEVNVPDKPFLTLMKYRNVNKLYFRAVETGEKELEEIIESYEKYNYDFNKFQRDVIKRFADKTPVHRYDISLPDDGDFQFHKAEVKVPALKNGLYILMAGTDENMNWDENAVAYCIINVSNISYISKNNEDQNYEFYILNRDNGSPLNGASAEIFVEEYNYDKSRYEYTSGGTFTSDKDGYFRVPAPKKYRRFYADFEHNGDFYSTKDYNLGYGYRYYSGAFYQSERYAPDKRPYEYTYFFTDRSIYRPGQIVYFKGLVLEYRGEEKEIRANRTVTVEFYDVNYQKVSEQTLTTNEYGTFSGSFTAPNAGLNGQMHIQTSNNSGSAYFSVEDYKRPKFEVKIDDIRGSYKLGEIVPVKGLAKSYSGANIDNAEVKYRVVRKAVFPRYWWWYWWYDFDESSAEVEITNGVTSTDANGEFTISFNAIPDNKISKKLKPYFTYTVYADVTDINGETRSGEKRVSVGYQTLLLSTEIPSAVDKNGKTEFNIKTTNLSGVKEPVDVTITIHKLKTPDKPFRNRLWERPDKFIYSKEEFNRDFPLDEYSDESDITKWEKDVKAYEKSFETGTDSILYLNEIRGWNQGLYALEMKTRDKSGDEVVNVQYFTAYSGGETTIPYPAAMWYSMIKQTGEPGENAEFIGGTGYKNAKILVEYNGKDKLIKREWVDISNSQKLFIIPLYESYRGNIGVSYTFVYGNRLYNRNDIVIVPHTDKMLDITFETFRDKLQPGQQEEWRIKIAGKNGDKVAAEMLAGMYDASLDAFKPHNWDFSILGYYYPYNNWSSQNCFGTGVASIYSENWNRSSSYSYISYDILNYFGLYLNTFRGYYMNGLDYEESGRVMEQRVMDEVKTEAPRKVTKDGKGKDDLGEKKEAPESEDRDKGIVETTVAPPPPEDFGEVVARKDFRETAFFFPDLKTNENGEVILSFQMPEALTRWKLMGFAHTKDLKYGFTEKTVITQKDLMVTPNVPRFLREEDKLVLSAKITNLSENDLNGEALLELLDALTMQPLDEKMGNTSALKSFEVKKGQSTAVEWEMKVPFGLEAVTYRIKAKADKFSDGEESALPVLTNRMMVTETMPMPIRSYQTKNFTMDKLINNSSPTAYNYRLTLEFTSNPAWYAIQALPYLIEYPYECAEQLYSRIYANSIATHIANSNPKIKQVFDEWRSKNPDALLSNLEKNQELKSLLLEETPWVLQAKNESERKRRVAVLFEINIMRMELDRAIRKLSNMQASNGAWPWFEGMPEDRYITQHIVQGFGKLKHLGITGTNETARIEEMTESALDYLDRQIRKDYEYLVALDKQGKIKLSDNHLGGFQIHYLYTRSFFKDIELAGGTEEAFNYFKGQAEKYWNGRGMYMEGMIALALHRYGEKSVPQMIVSSLREYAIVNEEMGMYWKDNEWGYYWYQAPIETQSLLIEVFDEVANDTKAVDDMKVWLLKQKQTQDWKTTKATVEACYALLIRGSDWLETDFMLDISIGGTKIDPMNMEDVKVEAGTGYFKTSWMYGDVKPEMGNVTVTKKNEGVSWGALYWQYFEDLDKITRSETPLKLDKKLFLQTDTETGPVITPIDENTKLKVGDLVKVRIELRVDRDMEYVHMKDMRAAGFEPTNVISRYKYQEGLGYYESTRDAATNFFFGWLPKGTYVFEYPLRANLSGDFSNGITTIQCMYAPEFTSHSEGVRVKID